MKKLIIAASAFLMLFPVEAQTAVPSNKNLPKGARRKMTPEQAKRFQMVRLGGFIKDTRNLKGMVAIVNAQKTVDPKWLDEAAEVFSNDVQLNVRVLSGDFDLKNPALKGEVTVFVVDDSSLPMSLVAPEAHWSVINIASLKTSKEAFFKARVQKLMVRGIVPLLSGADSSYPLCLMGPVEKAEDLDKFMGARLPVDVIERMRKNYATYGLGSWRMTTYRAACHQGWAPTPTNKYQKAIWNEIHTLPTKPITIDPEKK
jgi:hypothetical protein